jgi:hypothetical protein
MKTTINAELAKLAAQREQTIAQLHALAGAEQALNQLLEQLQKEETENVQ